MEMQEDIFNGCSELIDCDRIIQGFHLQSVFFQDRLAVTLSITQRPTVCVTCVWAGVDNAWEQEKLEARKILENGAESHTSGARFVGTLLTLQNLFFITPDLRQRTKYRHRFHSFHFPIETLIASFP